MTVAVSSCLPNLFLLGVTKSGTTTLHAVLKQHPEVYMTEVKEPMFFNNDERFSRGLGYYADTYFPESSFYRVRGESTPVYFPNPEIVAPRLRDAVGDLNPKFILLFRDPVARAYSHYRHMVRVEAETEDFGRALELEEDRLRDNPRAWVGYYKEGLYGTHLQRWLEYFPRPSFLVLKYEDAFKDLRSTMEEVCRHLGVGQSEQLDCDVHLNPNAVARSSFVMKLTTKPPTPLKRVVKALLTPDQIRAVRQRVRRANVVAAPPKPLSVDAERALRTRYAEDDALLCRLTGISFST